MFLYRALSRDLCCSYGAGKARWLYPLREAWLYGIDDDPHYYGANAELGSAICRGAFQL
jgi:hypothetical protein